MTFEVGDYLYASWGYDQTNIDFAQIVEVSQTGKTVVCQMTKTEKVEDRGHANTLVPTETYGDQFTLYVRGDGVYFRGKYPFCNGKKEDGLRMGTFWPWDGKPKNETKAQFGH